MHNFFSVHSDGVRMVFTDDTLIYDTDERVDCLSAHYG